MRWAQAPGGVGVLVGWDSHVIGGPSLYVGFRFQFSQKGELYSHLMFLNKNVSTGNSTALSSTADTTWVPSSQYPKLLTQLPLSKVT